jgi:hypothetical protein
MPDPAAGAGGAADGAAVTGPEQLRRRAAELEHARESATDEVAAGRAADELHALLDDADEEGEP